MSLVVIDKTVVSFVYHDDEIMFMGKVSNRSKF